MNILSSIFTVVVSLALPLAAAVGLCVKRKGFLKPVLLGAATFFVFQMVLRLPLIQYVLSPMPWFITMGILQPGLTALFYGLTAALFEEGGRCLVMRLFMKKNTRVTDGIAFGIGHGGIEAILLVGINALVVLVMGSAQDAGGTFAAGIERLFTMSVHVAWSVMVLKSVAGKKPLWLLLAFVLHMFIDTAVVFVQQAGLSAFWIETIIGLFAVVMTVFTCAQYGKYKGEKKNETEKLG